MKLEKRIRHIREKKKMTMKEVARKIGVSVSTYRDWEYGRKIPASRIPKIAEALGVTTGKLLGELEQLRADNLEHTISLLEEALKNLRKIAC